jgi:2-methylisocitrate lyase-like PEP mutase family enzyme
MNAEEKRAQLASRVRSRELTVAPGVFEMISARVADGEGFEALYMTGYGISASHLGVPDAGLASYNDMADRARTICAGTNTPLIADADTGFGGLLNVRQTVRGYEDAGVAAVQIEDQEFPKKCGHAEGRRVIPLRDMVKKVEVAVEARSDDNLLIIARTDARTALGLDEAIARGVAFAEAGADVVFVESPESEDEFRRISDEIDAPLVANMVEGGFSPILSADTLRDLGFAIAIYPCTGFMSVAALLKTVYAHLRTNGTSDGLASQILPITEMHHLMGFEDVWDFDNRWAD